MDFTYFANIVNGKPRLGSSFYRGVDPTSRKKLWDVPIATSQDLDDAVQAAQDAFKSWSIMPMEDRRAKCMEFAKLYKQHLEDFDKLIRKECGKPVCSSTRPVHTTLSQSMEVF
jgi:acyl-CoA reductase-like NAD-dependent aldehyde dehydrogenase